MLPTKEKQETLLKKMLELGIFEEDLVEKFIIGSGSGGQKINKTHSCVYLKHLPSGIEVKCQKERSRELNRFFARRMLCEKYEQLFLKKKSDIQKKIKKQKNRRKRRAKKTDPPQ